MRKYKNIEQANKRIEELEMENDRLQETITAIVKARLAMIECKNEYENSMDNLVSGQDRYVGESDKSINWRVKKTDEDVERLRDRVDDLYKEVDKKVGKKVCLSDWQADCEWRNDE
jgi:SMC interacting uncharacterized protein involved in chromosome segregation